MELELQKVVLSALVSDRDLMAITSSMLKPSYFDTSLKKPVKFLIDYFEKYRDVPKHAVMKAETGLALEDIGRLSRADFEFLSKETATFCRNRAVAEKIISGPTYLEKGDFGGLIEGLKEAIAVGLQQDLGMDYFKDPEERLRQTLITEAKISTGWPELDLALGGGIGRQELLMFAANSGVGKSMTMLNLARNLLAKGLNGVYISLEMAEGVVSKRLDSMISKIGQDSLLKELNKVAAEVEKAAGKMGKFIIKRMPENRTNVNHIRSYLQQLEQATGFRPDFIVVDYIDIMGTTHSVSHDNLFIKDKFVTEEVRSLGFDFNAIMISASQLGRGAIDAEKVSQAHIQGGISKINTADYVVALRQDDLMRAAGEMGMEILKSRNSGGVNKKLLMGWDPVSLVISSNSKDTPQLKVTKKPGVVLETPASGKNGIMSLISD